MPFAGLPTLIELQATSSKVKERAQFMLLFSGVLVSGLNVEY